VIGVSVELCCVCVGEAGWRKAVPLSLLLTMTMGQLLSQKPHYAEVGS
jgi:hypothetical protein